MNEVDLDFAGRYGVDKPVHKAIAALSTGDVLSLCRQDGKWMLQDKHGQNVGRLSSHFQKPEHMVCIEAKVISILVPRKEESKEQYQSHIRNNLWELVIPELTFSISRAVCF